jgi:hypothetical protein
MQGFLRQADGVLRATFPFREGVLARTVFLHFLKYICLCGLGYGAVMGSFSGVLGDRFWQVLYSSAKVPFLLLGTFLICLPSFFVFNTLFGVRSDFTRALGALAASQAGLTLVLCALAPLTVVWYVSFVNYSAAILFNGLMFAVASLAAQIILRRLYRPLIFENRKHLLLLRIWLGLYVFVGIQLGWLLRPFIGQPGLPVQMFRDEAWGNAYLNVARHVWDALTQ